MVGGQTLDMDSENTPIELHTLEQIHKAKTGALLKIFYFKCCGYCQCK